MPEHEMTAEAQRPGEVLFVCSVEGCGRRVVVRPGELIVLDRGDVAARHRGSVGGVEVGAPVPAPVAPPAV